jgi:hypothetical protein
MDRPKTALRSGVAGYLLIAAISLWLRSGFPVAALGAAAADDGLFIRLARSLAEGRWLGPYDNLTLAKGMFYPLFIAASAMLAIPLTLAEQAVYLATSAMVAAFVGRRTGNPWLGLAMFALLAFNPVAWDLALARVIREALYGSLSLAVIGLAVLVGFGRRPVPTALLGVALGIVTGAFWLTREEGLWIVPALVAVLAMAGVGLLARGGTRDLARLGGAVLLAVAGFTATNGVVAGLNRHYYGVFETNEFKSRSFERAYGALARVHQDTWHRYVVFPTDARQRAYAVSPAAAELRPFFDGAGGANWRFVGCDQLHLPQTMCTEILSGWFMWALRDAVTAAGHGGSARAARAFYTQLADQIDAACADGRLECLPPRATLAPPFRWRYVTDTLHEIPLFARIVLTFGGGIVGSIPSSGNPEQLAAFTDMVGEVTPQSATVRQRLVGWVTATGGAPDLAVRSAAGSVLTTLTLRSGADVEQVYPGLVARRFELVSDCVTDGCELVVAPHDGGPTVIPWSRIAVGDVLDTATLKLHLESVSRYDTMPVTSWRRGLQRRIAGPIGRAYAMIAPIGFVLALAGLAAATVLRRGPPLAVYTLALASLVAIACRILLLAFLDSTSIPANNTLYASPASPFVIVFVVTGLFAGWAALRPVIRPVAAPLPTGFRLR